MTAFFARSSVCPRTPVRKLDGGCERGPHHWLRSRCPLRSQMMGGVGGGWKFALASICLGPAPLLSSMAGSRRQCTTSLRGVAPCGGPHLRAFTGMLQGDDCSTCQQEDGDEGRQERPSPPCHPAVRDFSQGKWLKLAERKDLKLTKYLK